MEEFIYETRIPQERVAVLIGTKGEKKREIEKNTKTKIEVDSKEGDITISGEDSLGLYVCREIVTAIGRGFNPEIAHLLLKPDYVLEMLNIKDYAKSKDSEIRLKGRVIGKEGKSRRLIEELSECYITVYGKTISLIGEGESVFLAKRAIELLLKGSEHSTVYKFLEKKRKDLKREAMRI